MSGIVLGTEPKITDQRIVYRYQIDLAGESIVEMQATATIRGAALSRVYPDRVVDVWAEHELYNTSKTVKYRFMAIYTGWSVPAGMRFVDTIVHPATGLVYHVYVGALAQ